MSEGVEGGRQASGAMGVSTLTQYSKLKTNVDAALADLVELARLVTGGRAAWVSLLDERTGWFDETVGVTPKEASALLPICAYALTRHATTVLPDVTAVPALAGEAVVSGPPGVRMFAAEVLRAESGAAVGVLAAFDTIARPLTDAQQEGLALVARRVEARLVQTALLADLKGRHEGQLARLQTLDGLLRAASSLAVLSVDLAGTVLWASEGATALLGADARDLVGRSVLALYDEHEVRERTRDAPEGTSAVLSALTGGDPSGAPVEREWTWRRKGGDPRGETFPARVVVAPSRDEDGDLIGFVAVGEDVTTRKAAERAQTDFIASVSHELRSPLTAIRGSLGLLLGGIAGLLVPEAVELLRVAESNGERLGRLVDDLLESARLESGFAFTLGPHDLHPILDQAVATSRPYAERLQVALRLEPLTVPVPVHVDEGRILQVLTNLLSNAAKFSPSGGTVALRAVRDQDSVRVEVSDEGPGIPLDFRSRIFGRFMQAGGDRSAVHGSGLGLNIARAIVERHGGRIGFDSEVGRGSTFFFELPLRT